MGTDIGSRIPEDADMGDALFETTDKGKRDAGQGEPTNTGSVLVNPPTADELERERRHKTEIAKVDEQIDNLEREINKLKKDSLDLNVLAILRLKKTLLENIRYALSGILRMMHHTNPNIAKKLQTHYEKSLLANREKLKDLTEKERITAVKDRHSGKTSAIKEKLKAVATRTAESVRRERADVVKGKTTAETELDSSLLEDEILPPPIPELEHELTDEDLEDAIPTGGTVDFAKIANKPKEKFRLLKVLKMPPEPTVSSKASEEVSLTRFEVPKIYTRSRNEPEAGIRTDIIPRLETESDAKDTEDNKRELIFSLREKKVKEVLVSLLKKMEIPSQFRSLFTEDAALLEELTANARLLNGEVILNPKIFSKFVSAQLEEAKAELDTAGIKLDRFGDPKVSIIEKIFTNKAINQKKDPRYQKYKLFRDLNESLPDPDNSSIEAPANTEEDKWWANEIAGREELVNETLPTPPIINSRPRRNTVRSGDIGRAAATATILGGIGVAVHDEFDADYNQYEQDPHVAKAPTVDTEPEGGYSNFLREQSRRTEEDSTKRFGRRNSEARGETPKIPTATAATANAEIDIVVPKTGETIHSVKKPIKSTPKPKFGLSPEIQRLGWDERHDDLSHAEWVTPGAVAKTRATKEEIMLDTETPLTVSGDTEEEDTEAVLPTKPEKAGHPGPEWSVSQTKKGAEKPVTMDKDTMSPHRILDDGRYERTAKKLFTQVLIDSSGKRIRFSDYATLILKHAPEAKPELTKLATRFRKLGSLKNGSQLRKLLDDLTKLGERYGVPH
ncbi:MAG: hypothetical protein AAB390_00110 [Patescibacteria group bacterium]